MLAQHVIRHCIVARHFCKLVLLQETEIYKYIDCCLQDSETKETAVIRGNSTKDIFMLAIPTFFDLVATVLMNIGLLSVTASVYQMMRGAEMLFAALFAVTFLHRNLNRFHMMGILCCVVGDLHLTRVI